MFDPKPISDETERIAREIVDAAFHVHTALGSGLLESIYEACLVHDLTRREIGVRRQVPVPIVYKGLELEAGLRLDLLVGEHVIVEIKSIERLLPVHEAQILSYLRLAEKRLGLLINFNVVRIKEGIRRFAL
jgi:GxxExxY protein